MKKTHEVPVSTAKNNGVLSSYYYLYFFLLCRCSPEKLWSILQRATERLL